MTTEWQRFEISLLFAGTSGNCYLTLNTIGTPTFEVWGAQVELSDYPTSYITTTTTSATRGRDELVLTFNDNIPKINDDVTIIIDFDYIGIPDIGSYLWNVAGETSRYVFISQSKNIFINHGATSNSFLGASSDETLYRIGYVANGSLLTGFLDGDDKGSITQETVVGTGTQISLGMLSAGITHMYGHIRTFRIYNKALNKSQMRIA